MKKIFIPALLFLFVSSVALAETKFTIGGSYEFGGRYILNNSLGNGDATKLKTNGAGDTIVDETKKENAAYNFQYLDINVSASVDSFSLYLYSNPFDRKIGSLDPTADGTINTNYIDRAFATYAFLPNLVFVGGRVKAGGVLDDGDAPFAGGYEYLGFGSGAYNTLFSERVNGDGLGVIFVANENFNLTFVNERYVEGDLDNNIEPLQGGGRDYDGYILKANIATGDIVVRPYISWVSLPDDAAIVAPTPGTGTNTTLDEAAHALAFYVGGGYNPASGLSVNAAFGLNKYVDGAAVVGASQTVDVADIPLSFGGYLNVAFAQDIFKVGLEAAYASYKYDDISIKGGAGAKAGVQGFYQFGGDFDRTYVIDQRLGAGSTSNGIPAMTTIQLYAQITPIEKLTLAPRIAYYFSNVNDKKGSVRIGADLLGIVTDSAIGIGEDTTFIEVDLIALYSWTASTTIYGGLVYVQADKVDVVGITGTSGYDKYSPDPAFGVAWGLATTF